jgi:hypothetical protein
LINKVIVSEEIKLPQINSDVSQHDKLVIYKNVAIKLVRGVLNKLFFGKSETVK